MVGLFNNMNIKLMISKKLLFDWFNVFYCINICGW
jgi:hypothetical protein